ncbi:MAG: NAD-dependent epimerase/dehydratase family protein, partial [Deltaproteobacteria bacterium]|nr:NAD-dependent epimerase/dehydratase family protein [Deltaproteobacteria bacterium]
MKALVTGGGGFLGRYIVEKLIGRGDSVRILARNRYAQ